MDKATKNDDDSSRSSTKKMNSTDDTNNESLWIFGYGSLIWKQNFPFVKSVQGQVRGFKRRFWQASEDHRGVPGKPGRVVTIVPTSTLHEHDEHGATPHTVGVAFLIDGKEKQAVLEYLDFREKGGYSTEFVDVFENDDAKEPLIKNAMLYTGTIENEMFVGPHDGLDATAHIIAHSVGPSGPNIEYLVNLAEALRQRQVHDDHVFDLERKVLEIKAKLQVDDDDDDGGGGGGGDDDNEQAANEKIK